MTNTRPRRRTTCEPGMFFNELIEWRTFMVLASGRYNV
jgi:hypothetical protein